MVNIFIPARISSYIRFKVCDEITDPIPNLNRGTVVFGNGLAGNVITYPGWDKKKKWNHVSKKAPHANPIDMEQVSDNLEVLSTQRNSMISPIVKFVIKLRFQREMGGNCRPNRWEDSNHMNQVERGL